VSDHQGYGGAPGMIAFLLIRALWGLGSESKRPAPVPVPAKKPIITPPPAATAVVTPAQPPQPSPPPVVCFTSDRELLAWRAWRLAIVIEEPAGGQGERPERRGVQGVRLISLSAPCVWDGPAIRGHAVPIPDQPGGIYALKEDLSDVVGWRLSEQVWVTGRVALSGRVIEHTLGYRAERAVVRELRLGVATHLAVRRLNQLGDLIAQLEDRYQAPVDAGIAEREIADQILASGFKARVAELPVLRLEPPWRLA
jgi:hypothetical protein